MHGLNRGKILVYDAVKGSSSFLYVPDDSSDDPDVRIGIYKDLYIAEVSELLILKDKDALHHYDLGGINRNCLIDPVVDGEIIYGSLYGLTLCQSLYMLNHDIRIKGVGMVVIDLFSFLKGNVIMLFIVEIVAQDADIVIEFLLYLVDKGALAASCAAGDSYDDGFFHSSIPL